MMNAVRTTFLLAALTGLFMAVGYFIGGTGGMLMAFGFAAVTNIIAYWNADKIVLRMQHAREIGPRQAPDLYDMVSDLAQRAGLPMPRLYVIETDQPNAFATGRNPENAAVAVSSGLLRMLERDEVAGVVAHELAHIKNRDTLTMTISATLAGAISMLAQFGLFFGGRNNNSPLGGVGTLLMVFLAPVAAMVVQMAVSRTREYEADHDGAEISGNPMALASALAKISKAARHFENPFARRNPGMAHMYIANPLGGSSLRSLFTTHPPVEKRIAALKALADQMRIGGQRPTQQSVNGRQYRDRPRRAGGQGQWRTPSAGAGSSPADRGPWG